MASVLVVDDDDTVRDALCDLLAEEHFSQGVSSAEEAIALLDHETYDVVLTDISMPGLSGVELLGYIKQRRPDTAVIVISGIRDKGYAQSMLNLGAFNYLEKPFSLAAVEASVTRALIHRRPGESAPDESAASSTLVLGEREEPKVYVLSICAMNARSQEYAHKPEVLLALSEDDAKQKGVEVAHRRWPRADGWISHNVTAAEVPEDILTLGGID